MANLTGNKMDHAVAVKALQRADLAMREREDLGNEWIHRAVPYC